MSDPSYSTFVLLPPGQRPTLDTAQTALEGYFADDLRRSLGTKVSRRGRRIHLRWDDFSFIVTLVAGEGVAEESQDIAQRITDPAAPRAAMAECSARFEVWSEGVDEGSDYFNHWLFVLDVLQRLAPGAILYDVVGRRVM